MTSKIDFVIPCHPKDFDSLKICIDGIKDNISCCNRIFVISNKNPNIDGVVHISESRYSDYINQEDISKRFESNLKYRTKWIYQQFLKLYSATVIPELTDSYVIVDSDTIFLRDVSFDFNKFYYCKAKEYHKPYLKPIQILLDTKETIRFSTICHHMIINKQRLNQMIDEIQRRFKSNSFFDCVLNILDYREASCMSEWDLYANYMILNHPEMCIQRQLKWNSISFVPTNSHLEQLKKQFDFVSCHAYIRGIE